jgi:hypothetical protein
MLKILSIYRDMLFGYKNLLTIFSVDYTFDIRIFLKNVTFYCAHLVKPHQTTSQSFSQALLHIATVVSRNQLHDLFL